MNEPRGHRETMLDQVLMAALTAAVPVRRSDARPLRSSPNVRIKADRSPVTEADLHAQAILLSR